MRTAVEELMFIVQFLLTALAVCLFGLVLIGYTWGFTAGIRVGRRM